MCGMKNDVDRSKNKHFCRKMERFCKMGCSRRL